VFCGFKNDDAIKSGPLAVIGASEKATAIPERWLRGKLDLLWLERLPNCLQLFHNRRLHFPGRVWPAGENERTCDTFAAPIS
jgi:hypothetical protein